MTPLQKNIEIDLSETIVPLSDDAETFKRKLAASELVVGEMIEELSSCYESLAAIFRYSAEQTRTGDLKPFAQRLLTDLLQIIGADWFLLRIVSADEKWLSVFAASEPELELSPLKIPASPATAPSIEGEAAVAHREVWFDLLRPLETSDPLAGVKRGSHGLVYPFFAGEQLIGPLVVAKSPRAKRYSPDKPGVVFTAAQTNVLATFADFLAIQIANARFQEEQVGNRVVARELEIASNIQQSLLPKHLPPLPGFELAAGCRSAHQVGGDFYDVLKISDHVKLFVVADVMGKGVPAAMFAAILRTMLRAAPELWPQPAALLTRVNRLLFEELSAVDMFITLQLACVDARERRLTLASAGHCPLLLAVPDAEIKTFAPDGIPLGIQSGTVFLEETIALPEGARVLIYTDGLTEVLNSAGERYGQEQLMKWFREAAARGTSAGGLKIELTAALEKFQANMALNDDQTFLIMAG